jgi:hypothetical protein
LEAAALSTSSAAARRRPASALARLVATASPLAAVALIAYVLLALAFQQGGYFPATFRSAGTIAFAGLGVLLVLRVPRIQPSSRALVALALLGLLAIWMGASAAWSPVDGAPREDMQRAMLYVALFGLGLVAANGRAHARLLVWALLGVLFAVAGAGLLSRLAPALLSDHAVQPAIFKVRLSYPLGYWNGFGALAAIGVALALGLAADVRSRAWMRAGAVGAATIMLVALYLSLSRGAWLALFAGLLALLALAPRRGAMLAATAIAGGAAAVAVLVLQSHPLLLDGSLDGAAQGREYLPELAAIVGGAAGLAFVVAVLPIPDRLRSAGRALLVSAAIVAVAVPLAGSLVHGASGESRTGAAIGAARDWVAGGWHDYMQPAQAADARGQSRLLSARGSRSDAYRVALDGWRAAPFIGEGAGSFEPRWLRTRTTTEKLRDAHSIVLGTMAELGLVGLLLLLAFVGAVATAAARARRGRGALRRAQAAAVTAALVVWLVHASIDWDWKMPVLTGAAIVLAATLFEVAGARQRGPAAPG